MTSRDPLEAGGPDLAATAGRLRDEWRAEEEEWSRAAAAQWTHGRRLVEIARELMHRGDGVAVTAARATFTGEVTHVGVDLLRVRTAGGSVDVHLAVLTAGGGGGRHVRLPAPVVLRVVERARSGGRRAGAGADSFRACLLEHEADAADVVVGTSLLEDDLRGTLAVGRDQLRVCDRDGGETYVPLAWVSWVMRWRE
ncbi:MAG: hypothetical protein ACT4PI_14975 [Actinomycetota bacterium]